MSPIKTALSFRSLNNVHEELNELFVRHQILLMHREIRGVLDIIHELQEKYSLHIHDEESLLLPVYGRRVDPVPQGGAVEFYIQEHKKIEQFLKRFIAAVSDWQQKGLCTPLRLVKLFDQHYTFNDLLNHHHAREDTFLYRLLDRVLNTEEKQALIQKISILPKDKRSR